MSSKTAGDEEKRRYPARERKKPKRYDDFVADAVKREPIREWDEKDVVVPESYKEPMISPQADEWMAAMMSEMDSLKLKEVLYEIPAGRKTCIIKPMGVCDQDGKRQSRSF